MQAGADDLLQSICADGAVPSIPTVVLQIVHTAGDPGTGASELVPLIEKDPALAAKTLKFANSSYYGLAKPISSVQQALVRLGTRTVRLLALSFGIVDACSQAVPAFSLASYWHRSLCMSAVARRVANQTVRKLADDAFIAGLLSDIGCPFLARHFPEKYKSVEALNRTGAKRLCDVEQSVLGISHAPVSAALLASWHLPADLVEAVAAHHDLSGLARDSVPYPIAATVMVASELTDLIVGPSSLGRIDDLTRLIKDYYGLTPGHLNAILKDLNPEVREIAQLLALPAPPAPLILAEASKEALRLILADSGTGQGATPAATHAVPSSSGRR